MNAIRAIHPDRNEGLWVFDEGQRSAFSGGMRRHAEPEEGCRVCSPTVPLDSACGRSPMAHGILLWMGDPTLSSVSRDIPSGDATS